MIRVFFIRLLAVFYFAVSFSSVALSMSQEDRDALYSVLLRQESLKDENNTRGQSAFSVSAFPSMVDKLNKQEKLVLAQELHKIYSEQGRDKFLPFLRSKKADIGDCIYAIDRDMFLVDSLLSKMGLLAQLFNGSTAAFSVSLALNLSDAAINYFLEGNNYGKSFLAASLGGYLALQGFNGFKSLRAMFPVRNLLSQRKGHDQDMLDLLNQELTKIKLKEQNPWWLEEKM